MQRGPRRGLPRSLFVLACAIGLIAAVSLAAQSGASVGRLLNETLGFSADDLRGLDRGSAVIRSLDTPVRQELAHVGVVYLDIPPDQFVERFRDIERFERGPRHSADRPLRQSAAPSMTCSR